MNSFLFYFIIFSCLTFENFSKCCCDCCDEEEYFLNSGDETKYNEEYSLNSGNETKYNGEYFLNSGYNINVPLNLEWYKCNCAILAVFRFLLSDKVLLERLTNKITSKKPMYEKDKKEINNLRTKKIFDKISSIFNDAKSKKGIYNEKIYNILRTIETANGKCGIGIEDEIRESWAIFLNFVRIYFSDLFINLISCDGEEKEDFFIYDVHLNELTAGTHKTNEYIFFGYDNQTHNTTPIENISLKQKDNSTKKYELVCGIVQAGDFKNVSDTDDAVILPVYDKNKQKKGYAAYQFDKILGLEPLEYWIKLDNFSGFRNPMFKVLVYKCMN